MSNTIPHFPNGFESWKETFFEFTAALISSQDNAGSLASNAQKTSGHYGICELAATFTDEFEAQNKDREWDGDFFDEIDVFLGQKEKEYTKGRHSQDQIKY